METNTSYQRGVRYQIGIGLLLIPVLGAVIWYLLPEFPESNRLRITLTSVGLAMLPMVVGIQLMLFRRFNSPDLIRGRSAGELLSIQEAFLANTLEQSVLAIGAIAVCGVLAPVSWLKLPLIGASLFCVGRVAYYMGYARDPMQRFLGFVVGHYSSLALLSIGLYFGVAGL